MRRVSEEEGGAPHDHVLQDAGTSGMPAAHAALQLLDRLEQLEQERAADSDDDDDDAGILEIADQVGTLGLTKGTRLPDAILLPNDDDC